MQNQPVFKLFLSFFMRCAHFITARNEDEEKMMQNGQTEPQGVTRRRTCVRREAKVVCSIKKFNYKIRYLTNFHRSFKLFLSFFMRCAHFITARNTKMFHLLYIKFFGGIIFDIIKNFGRSIKNFEQRERVFAHKTFFCR